MSMTPEALREIAARVSAGASIHGQVRYVETLPFGPALSVERFALGNGLSVLLAVDPSAEVVSSHTWFRVGSRHERPGKTGLAHLFEHLMFNEMQNVPAGEFDRRLEEAGCENNASTWLDWTEYTINLPSRELELVLELESHRMAHLVLREPQVASEKEVVQNERRYRVDDDVEGSINEELWSLCFEKHPYHWPVIGWMADIEGFTTADCEAFYRTYYAPNNATLILVGDLERERTLALVSRVYGAMPPSTLPSEPAVLEPEPRGERRRELEKPTATEKLAVGYRAPAFGDPDHTPLALLVEVLFGGRASRVHRRLVQELEIASDVGASVAPTRDPGLLEISASARGDHKADRLLALIDEELERATREPVTHEELARASARSELSLLSSLESADGKASTLGFYETVLGRPTAAFERLEAVRRATPGDLVEVARKYLVASRRSVLLVRPDRAPGDAAA